mgnify:CR=1 FL=1
MRPHALERWHEFIKSPDEKVLWGLLHPESVKKALLARVPKGTEELNEKAFEAGYALL